MKQILSLALALVLLLSMAACSGNYAQIDLNDPIAIPENGIIDQSVLNQVKNSNAIAVFTGSSAGLTYEWTVFGSDIGKAKDVNLSLTLSQTDKGVEAIFSAAEELGFPALLSIQLNEKWNAHSATAYSNDTPAYSVSITGSKTSILNLSVNKITDKIEIIPDTTDTPVKETAKPSTGTVSKATNTNTTDNYLSDVKSADNRIYSDGTGTLKDKYETDPVPVGKPMPVEPENQQINTAKTYTCTFSIECSTILNNLGDLDPDKLELVPSNGVILPPTTVTFYEGESVYDVLQRVCKNNGIHMEASWTPVYNSAYVEGIHNLYEFDCGSLSGWMYRVNGWYPNYGCSRYQLVDGEKVEWRYTCDLGKDVGCDWLAG